MRNRAWQLSGRAFANLLTIVCLGVAIVGVSMLFIGVIALHIGLIGLSLAILFTAYSIATMARAYAKGENGR